MSADPRPKRDPEGAVIDAGSVSRVQTSAGADDGGQEGEVRIGELIVEDRVADGAMGRVFRARHAGTGERLAVKVLHDEVAHDEVAVERFKREYETAFGFDHPHIVQMREFGKADDGAHFMTMELLEGEPLSDLLAREGRLAPARALRIVCQMAAALEHAHSFGVIHRDLKPANIFVAESPEGDRVKVLDFGSVKLQLETGPKLTAFGTTVGSPSYMSPEQAEGRADLDPRADVFALAAVAYEMLTGELAFGGRNAGEVLANILEGRPKPASEHDGELPVGIDLVLARGLRRDKSSRTPAAREFAESLLRVFGVEGDIEELARRPLDAWRVLDAASPPDEPRAASTWSEPPLREPEGSAATWILVGAAAAAVSAALLYLFV